MSTFKNWFTIAMKVLIGTFLVGCVVGFFAVIGIAYYILGTHIKNVSSDPRFSEMYNQVFELQRDAFIYRLSDDYCLRVGDFGDKIPILPQEVIKKGIKIRVAKILAVNRPLVGKSLKVIIELEDEKYASYKANSKQAIDASSLTNSFDVILNEEVKLQFGQCVKRSELPST